MNEPPLTVFLVGFGNVARTIARILTRQKTRFPKLSELKLRVVGVSTRTRGSLVDTAGIDLDDALGQVERSSRFDSRHPAFSARSPLELLKSARYDVLVELSTLNILEQGEPAATHIRVALENRAHVVTGNKGPLAFHFAELTALAEKWGRLLRYESTVMDGAPLFAMARASLRGCSVIELEGILNSTTNFVLSELELGKSVADAITEAQARGFAEADPRLDLEGWDAAAKIAVLCNALMGASITPHDVSRESLCNLPPEAAREARMRGCRLKMIGSARRLKGGLETSVLFRELPIDHPFATVAGPGSALKISTDLMGPLFILQDNPSLSDTAYGILNDLFEIQACCRSSAS